MVVRNLIKEQKYYTKEQLLNETPSRRDGVDAATEAKVRKTYCKLIDAAGQRLKMPQWAIATATVFCHRFYAVKSLRRNDRFLIPTACLFLAGKIDDSPRALNDVIVVCWEQRNKHKPQESARLRDQAFLNELRDLVLTAERGILYSRGFDLYVEHPYSPLTNLLKEYKLLPHNFPQDSPGKNLLQACWNFVNDSMKTTVSLLYSPTLIAKAITYLSARLLKVKLLFIGDKTFAEFFDMEQSVIEDICSQLMELYTYPSDVNALAVGKPTNPNVEDVGNGVGDALSPLLAAPQESSVQEAVNGETAPKVTVKTEEAEHEVGVQQQVGNQSVLDTAKEHLAAGADGMKPQNIDSCKKRKSVGDAADAPQLKAAKMESLAH